MNCLEVDMKISRQNDHYHIIVSRNELEILANCLREALSMLGEAEFNMRVGVKAAIVRERLEKMMKAAREL